MVTSREDASWLCLCEHDDRDHGSPAPYACSKCGCPHFRWVALDWTSQGLRALHNEKVEDELRPPGWMPVVVS